MSTYTNNPDDAPECNFGSTLNKGYFMNVNGFRISVQYGPGNYVDADIRYSRQPGLEGKLDGMDFQVFQGNSAEVMIDTPVGVPDFQMEVYNEETNNIIHHDHGTSRNDVPGQMGHNDTVFGHCTPECVAKMIGCIANSIEGEDTRAALVQIYQSNH